MFDENIEIIKNNFLDFKGSGMYIALFLVAIVYLYLKEENKSLRNFFIYTPLIILAITLNPLFHKIAGKILTSGIYWRVFWMLPLGITISYASVKVIANLKDKMEKIIVAISIITIIMISGKFIYTPNNYKKVGNLYKLPDEDVLVAYIIGADNADYKKAIVPPDLTAHIRQVDSNIKLSYDREPKSYDNHPIVLAVSTGNVKGIIKIAEEEECNYVVFEKAVTLDGKMEDYGFSILSETNKYVIYKDNDFKKEGTK